MKYLVDYYLNHQNYASKRIWTNWPFHKVYNYREKDNGGKRCIDKWKEIVNSNMETFPKVTNFDELHSQMKDWAKDVPGIGSLHIYDTATCFAQPNDIHLNCGAMVAAKAINARVPIRIKNGKAPYADFVAYDKELARLTPLQLEDFLCINKKVFQKILTPSEQLRRHKKDETKHQSCQGNTTPKHPKKCGC